MSKMIQIRNVPEAIHRKLKARAATAGMTLSDYLLQELREIATKPTLEELMARIPQYGDELVPSPAEIIREERDRR